MKKTYKPQYKKKIVHKFFPKKKTLQRFWKFFSKHKFFLFIVVPIVLIIWWIFLLLRFTIFHEDYRIQNVSFFPTDFETYWNTELYTNLSEIFEWKNYFMSSYVFKNSLKDELRQYSTMIKDFDLIYENPNSFAVDFEFYEPNLVFEDWERYLWVREGDFFHITTWSDFLYDTYSISLPEYTQELEENEFFWFFHLVDEHQLKLHMDKIREFIWEENIENIGYLPWGGRTMLEKTNWKIIYFNNQESISKQLEKYHILKEEYQDYHELEEIDLGSMDNIVVRFRENN